MLQIISATAGDNLVTTTTAVVDAIFDTFIADYLPIILTGTVVAIVLTLIFRKGFKS